MVQDAIFTALTARDRNVVAMLVELLCTAVVNFTFGMLVCIFAFVASLPRLLMSYQPTWVSPTFPKRLDGAECPLQICFFYDPHIFVICK